MNAADEFNETYKRCLICACPISLQRTLQDDHAKPVKTIFEAHTCFKHTGMHNLVPFPFDAAYWGMDD